MGKLRDIARQVKRKLQSQDDHFLDQLNGVIHVGANTGQEKELYRHFNLNVIWIEPIPDVFAQLQQNIEDFPRQTAYQYLITDQQNKEYEFNIASNQGQSSSILELDQHKDIWPNITYVQTINLLSSTLSNFIEKENIDRCAYDGLILDTQGSELLVLKGAQDMLGQFKYIQTEAADFAAYKGCCLLAELDEFLAAHGFKQHSKELTASRNKGGQYFNVLYQHSSNF